MTNAVNSTTSTPWLESAGHRRFKSQCGKSRLLTKALVHNAKATKFSLKVKALHMCHCFTDDNVVWLLLLLLLQVLYLVFVYGIFRPDESYLNSYRYLSSKDSWISVMLNLCGPRSLFYTLDVFISLKYVLAAFL